MKIPKEFVLKGKLWSVRYIWGLRDEGVKCDGLCLLHDREILLERGLAKEDKPEVFLHEFIHAVLHECHISGLDGVAGEFVEEVICDSLSSVLVDSFTMRWKRRRRV